MATLLPKSLKLLPDGFDTTDWKARIEAENAAFEELSAENDIISFGVGDGSADYLVVSKKPLKLQHIAHGDNYEVSYATIRGLRLSDVEEMLNWERSWDKL